MVICPCLHVFILLFGHHVCYFLDSIDPPIDDNCLVQYQVLYFKDFSHGAIPQLSMKALKSVDWRRYGLNLAGIGQQDGCALLEWENLSKETHIDIVLHSYHQQYPTSSEKFI